MPSINLNPYDYISYAADLKAIYGLPDPPFYPAPGEIGYNFGTTDHACWILDMNPKIHARELLEIQFLPESITGSRTSNLKNIKVVGRNNPFVHYTGGTETITLPLEFYSDTDFHDDVKRKIDWLRSLTIKDETFGYSTVKVVMGGDNKGPFRWEVFVVKSVQYTMSHFEGEFNFLPLRAKCTLQLQVVGSGDGSDDVTFNDLRNG